MAKFSTLKVVSGLVALALGCSGVDEYRPATVTCRPYDGPKIERTVKLGDGSGCPASVPTQVSVDTVCRAETDRGTAVGYLDSSIAWRGYCNPPDWTTGRLPNGVNGQAFPELPILKEGNVPCTPDPRVIGLDRNDGWLAKYDFERK